MTKWDLLKKALWLRRSRSAVFRLFFCWIVGLVALVLSQNGTHDLRFQLRGSKVNLIDSRIVLVDINEKDWNSIEPLLHSGGPLQIDGKSLREARFKDDSVFWRTQIWQQLLSRLLADKPASIGVIFHFGDQVETGPVSDEARALFSDPRVVWGADLDSTGRALIPLFASTYNRNVALRSLRIDDDGTLRRYSPHLIQIPHMGVLLAERAKESENSPDGGISTSVPNADLGNNSENERPVEINYLAGSGAFPTVSLKEIFEGHVPPDAFHRRIIIIGNSKDAGELFTTPLGRLTRSEVIANVVDNQIGHHIPHRLPFLLSAALLFLLAVSTVYLIQSYPQSVALVGIAVGSLSWVSISAWAFDSMSIWIPVIAPLAQTFLCYIVFLSYQTAVAEERSWKLERERQAASELETLKSNFVSMMSHDLKTPIAKIQAICDRLIARAERATTPPTEESDFGPELRNLRRSSEELHRYIRSILQMTRVESRDFQIHREPLDLNEAVERVVNRMQTLADEKHQTVSLKLEPLFSIEADGTLVEEMIQNLLENAIKYSPPHSQIEIETKETGEEVCLSVKDNGPGIDPKEQESLWNKFTRGRRSSLTTTGTGLGLYLVRYFTELHGGRVFISTGSNEKAEAQAGTTIGFYLPIG